MKNVIYNLPAAYYVNVAHLERGNPEPMKKYLTDLRSAIVRLRSAKSKEIKTWSKGMTTYYQYVADKVSAKLAEHSVIQAE
jgi:hypothetical protein